VREIGNVSYIKATVLRPRGGTIHPPTGADSLFAAAMFSGGGIAEGQVIGATDRRGEHLLERRVGVGDFLATLYRHLGIDAGRKRGTATATHPRLVWNLR
jgi:hypothetical protein